MKIIAISGSLRAVSLNTAVLHAAGRLAPAGVEILVYEGIGQLPFFNPDLDGERLPRQIADFRNIIGTADGLLISSPEYARGVAGVTKNALDWLVGSFEFPNKPVALINTSPRATHAQAALTITLETMSARLVKDASITLPLLGTVNDADSIATNPEFAGPLRSALEIYVRALRAIAEEELHSEQFTK
ncbi:NAD(P)H-dependent oxidoreductase [Bradyrhizobium sediminis]|uniref:NAD(P)H-dependent oxidoreductase n=1 Tax=Bradyrhizobium sediminis TaxID=2840469 RepID=A0A975NY46_9BRAD|nr:NADPH-dependent FMN reductase [Bradyrhizobium sediminis]QWG23125.1 NAD(P)H-dependent oxidoreductase [Bradyrhizobium sediminis]